MYSPCLTAALQTLHEDSRSLWLPSAIREYNSSTTALQFLRDHVSQSLPCVWRAAASNWTAVHQWADPNFNYLRQKIGTNPVQVAWTPDGRADAIVQCNSSTHTPSSSSMPNCHKVFAMPYQTMQPFSQLLDQLITANQHDDAQPYSAGVPYYSDQDSSLSRQVPQLLADIGHSDIDFAKEAFDAPASATNIWIGDARSVTSTHADPFENVYTVISGTKIFELRPPCDAAFLRKPSLPNARWLPHPLQTADMRAENYIEHLLPLKHYDGWKLVTEHGTTEWIDEHHIDLMAPTSVVVHLHAGDMLYLPALWFHKVSQIGVTIAVNWWFEMSFGRDWIYKQLCFNVGKCELEGRESCSGVTDKRLCKCAAEQR